MKPILAICREEKISKKKSLYGIGFVMIFSIVTNLQMFWFYGIRTDINMDLNCNQTFYLWSVLIPAMVIRFLVPMIILTVTNVLTIRKVFTLLMFTAWLQLDYGKILCNFCLLEFTRGPNGKCFNEEFALAFIGKCYK